MTIQNLGGTYTFDERETSLPVLFKVGASFNAMRNEQQRLTCAVEFQHPADNVERANVGVECGPERAVLRPCRLPHQLRHRRSGLRVRRGDQDRPGDQAAAGLQRRGHVRPGLRQPFHRVGRLLGSGFLQILPALEPPRPARGGFFCRWPNRRRFLTIRAAAHGGAGRGGSVRHPQQRPCHGIGSPAVRPRFCAPSCPYSPRSWSCPPPRPRPCARCRGTATSALRWTWSTAGAATSSWTCWCWWRWPTPTCPSSSWRGGCRGACAWRPASNPSTAGWSPPSAPCARPCLTSAEAGSPTLFQSFGLVLEDVPFRSGRITVDVYDVNERREGLPQPDAQAAAGSAAAPAPGRPGRSPAPPGASPWRIPCSWPTPPWRTGSPGATGEAMPRGWLHDYMHPSRRYGLEQDRLQVFQPVWPQLGGVPLEADSLGLLVTSRQPGHGLRRDRHHRVRQHRAGAPWPRAGRPGCSTNWT